MQQWHRCKTTDLYEVRRAGYHEDANAGREAHRVIFRNAHTKALVTPEMGEILYKRELDYWFTHWWSDGEWNSKPYYISQDQLASLMDANNCIRIPIDMGFFRTNIEIKLDRATLLRSNICIVSKQFLQEHFYKEQAEAKKIYDNLQSLNAQYLKNIHHWQNKYNLLKEEIEMADANKCDGCKFYCNGRCFGEKNAPYVEYADCQGENNRPDTISNERMKDPSNEFGIEKIAKIFGDMTITNRTLPVINKILSDDEMVSIILNAYRVGVEDGCAMVDKIYKEEISHLKKLLGIKKEEKNKPTAKIDEEEITQLKKFLGIEKEENNDTLHGNL